MQQYFFFTGGRCAAACPLRRTSKTHPQRLSRFPLRSQGPSRFVSVSVFIFVLVSKYFCTSNPQRLSRCTLRSQGPSRRIGVRICTFVLVQQIVKQVKTCSAALPPRFSTPLRARQRMYSYFCINKLGPLPSPLSRLWQARQRRYLYCGTSKASNLRIQAAGRRVGVGICTFGYQCMWP